MRIAFFNQNGLIVKTMTTLNLDAAIVRDGGQPLVLDLDPEGHHSVIFGSTPRNPGHSLFGIYQGIRTLDELVIPLEGGFSRTSN